MMYSGPVWLIALNVTKMSLFAVNAALNLMHHFVFVCISSHQWKNSYPFSTFYAFFAFSPFFRVLSFFLSAFYSVFRFRNSVPLFRIPPFRIRVLFLTALIFKSETQWLPEVKCLSTGLVLSWFLTDLQCSPNLTLGDHLTPVLAIPPIWLSRSSWFSHLWLWEIFTCERSQICSQPRALWFFYV